MSYFKSTLQLRNPNERTQRKNPNTHKMTRTQTKYLSVTAALLAAAVTSNAALTTDLVAYYDFDDLANDAAGSAAALTEAGTGGYTGTATGVYGSAAEFTGTNNDYINATVSFGAGNALGSSFTVAAWYNLDTAVTGSRYVFEGDTNYDLSYGVTGPNGTVATTTTYAGPNDPTTKRNHVDAHTQGVWQHVLVTYVDNAGTTTVSTYIDGAVASTITGINTSDIAASGIHIGNARDVRLARPFDGKIDEFGAWSRVLDSAEIAQVYDNGVNGVALTVVPEPSSAALLGLGGLALILRRRK